MQFLRVRLVAAGPLSDIVLDVTRSDGRARPFTCVFGGPGTGKTTLVLALASTRPGCTAALPRYGARAPGTPWAAADWSAGDDEPARLHPVRITSPGALLDGESEEATLMRRREQTMFERKAGEGGFVFVAFPGSRSMGRAPVLLSAPDRSLGRYDVRATALGDDGTRADLARETKQTLAYAAIGEALALRFGQKGRVTALFESVKEALSQIAEITGYRFAGCDPVTLEPAFQSVEAPGARASFDDLPTGARTLVAFVALPLRAAFAAYPDRAPRDAEVVVAVDDAELHLSPLAQRTLAGALQRALPRAQWILTTSSPHIAAGIEPEEIVTLRRLDANSRVELFTGPLALVH